MTLPTNWQDGQTVHDYDINAIEATINSALQPLSTVTIRADNTAPAIGQTTYYDASTAALNPTLLPLSTLSVGARFAVRRDPADKSLNPITLGLAGSDTLYSSGETSISLPLLGEQREYHVISVSGTKYWAPAGSLNSVSALQSLIPAVAKLQVIADNAVGTSNQVNSTSTSGTSEQMFTVGVACTNIVVEFEHWFTTETFGTGLDGDPSGPITFNASLRVLSSTNPGTATNVLYRLTFNGRTAGALDPAGRVASDPIGISLAPGDVIAVRTYLATGTAYSPRAVSGFANTSWGGFTSGTDLTAPGSGAVSLTNFNCYGPSSILGHPQSANNDKSVGVWGDSIPLGTGDGFDGPIAGHVPNAGWYGGGGFLLRALSGVAGVLNCAAQGDTAASFVTSAGSYHRLKNALRCNSAIITYGTNDIFFLHLTAATLEANNLQIATVLRRMGTRKIFLTSVIPSTTSTDQWATTTNQTAKTGETQRVAYNTWLRAGCPINPTTLAPVAVGTANALLAGQFGHPITGFFDTAAKVESSLNSGLWLPCQRVTTGSMTATGVTLTSSGANFQTAKQESGGDLGATFSLVGAGVGAANLVGWISAVGSTTSVTSVGAASTTVSNAVLAMGVSTIDGIHPSTEMHYAMSQAINPALL